MRKFFSKIKINKSKALLVLLFSLAICLAPTAASAGFMSWLVGWSSGTLFSIVSTLLYLPIYFLGWLSSLLITVLVFVANYNDFIDKEAVKIGWSVVRDLANMFVVMGILIIAIGTLFNIDTYSYKKLLPKLIIAAIVVNFSKMIIGVMIDMSQVITLTFVHGFQDIAAGNLVNAIGLDKIVNLHIDEIRGAVKDTPGGDKVALSVLSSLLLGTVVLVVTVAMLVVLIAYFVGRIIILWMAIILSPLLFVLPFIPKGEKFASQVWEMISKQLMAGPLLAFFLWLSFLIMDTLKNPSDSLLSNPKGLTQPEQQFEIFATQIGTINGMLNFVVVVGLLFSSLMLASQMGAAGGKMAGNLAGKMQGAGKWLAQRPQKWAKAGGLAMGRKADKWSILAQKRIGIERPISMRPSIIGAAWKESRKRKEEEFYKAKGISGGMEDVFNRVFGGVKSNEKQIEIDSHIAQERKRKEVMGTKSEIVLQQIDNEADTYIENGVVKINHAKSGRENALFAGLQTLMANTDMNDLLIRQYDKEGPLQLRKFIEESFPKWSDTQKAGAYNTLAGIGYVNKNTHYEGAVRMNEKEEWEFIGVTEKDQGLIDDMAKEGVKDFVPGATLSSLSQEQKDLVLERKIGRNAATLNAKKTDRDLVQKTVGQSFWRQVRDEETGGYRLDFKGGLTEGGKEAIKKFARAYGTEANNPFMSSELKNNFTDPKAIESLKGYLQNGKDKGFLNGQQQIQIQGMIDNIEVIRKGKKNKKVEAEGEEQVDHREQVTQKRQKISENEENYTILSTDLENHKRRAESIRSKDGPESTAYTNAQREVKERENRINENRAETKKFNQEIYAEHYPAMASEAIAGLGTSAFTDPEAVNKLSQKIGESITEAMANVGKSDFDFEEVAKNMEGNFTKLGETIKGSVKDASQAPDLSFVTAANMSPLNETATQSKMLSKLKEIAESLKTKTAGGK